MTVNELANWYYLGLITTLIHMTVMGFIPAPDKDEIRWRLIIELGYKYGLPPPVSVVLVYLTSLWWPFLLVKKIITLLRGKKK